MPHAKPVCVGSAAAVEVTPPQIVAAVPDIPTAADVEAVASVEAHSGIFWLSSQQYLAGTLLRSGVVGVVISGPYAGHARLPNHEGLELR